jgi:hypothetical protein
LTGDATTGFCIRQRCPSEWCDSDGSSTISRGWIFQERMLAARTITARRYPGSVSAWMRPRVGPKATRGTGRKINDTAGPRRCSRPSVTSSGRPRTRHSGPEYLEPCR